MYSEWMHTYVSLSASVDETASRGSRTFHKNPSQNVACHYADSAEIGSCSTLPVYAPTSTRTHAFRQLASLARLAERLPRELDRDRMEDEIRIRKRGGGLRRRTHCVHARACMIGSARVDMQNAADASKGPSVEDEKARTWSLIQHVYNCNNGFLQMNLYPRKMDTDRFSCELYNFE
eukprot:6202653-Pleurochrysis_carterae.AAC.6